MITGDNILTAAHVAKEIQIGSSNEKVLFIEVENDLIDFWDFDGKSKDKLTLENIDLKWFSSLFKENLICIKGSCLTKL